MSDKIVPVPGPSKGEYDALADHLAQVDTYAGGLLFATTEHTVSNVDANNYKSAGTYYFATGCSNVPAQYFLCLVIADSTDFVIQLGVCAGSSGSLRYRVFASNAWGAWKTLTGT